MAIEDYFTEDGQEYTITYLYEEGDPGDSVTPPTDDCITILDISPEPDETDPRFSICEIENYLLNLERGLHESDPRVKKR